MDRDLLREAAYRQQNGIFFTGVIFARQRHISIGDLIEDIELIAQVGTPKDFANRVTFLPL